MAGKGKARERKGKEGNEIWVKFAREREKNFLGWFTKARDICPCTGRPAACFANARAAGPGLITLYLGKITFGDLPDVQGNGKEKKKILLQCGFKFRYKLTVYITS